MSPAVDFMRAPSPPKLGWALLLCGVAALVAATALDSRYAAARAEADRVAQTQLDLERQRREPVKTAPPTAAELRVRQAEIDSRAPWLATLRAIEATTQDPVYLRSLVVEPAAAVVKLDAEAPTFAEALSYAQALDAEALFRPALLTSHEEAVDPSTGKRVVRFSVVARWNRR